MYLISTVFKKTRLGGKRLCSVYYIANLKSRPIEITDQVAKKFDFTYNKGCIVIHNGSGTGFMRISEKLKEGDKKIAVFHISVFNQ